MSFSTNEPFVFETDPVAVEVDGRWLCAWVQWRRAPDRIVAKWIDDERPVVLSSPGATAGRPQFAVAQADVWLVWESCRAGRWAIVGRLLREGNWQPERRIADDAFDPALCVDDAGAAWCVCVASGARRLKLIKLAARGGPAIDVPTMGAGAYRPRVTTAGGRLHVTWETHTETGCRVCAWPVGGEPQAVSDGPGRDLAHTACSDADGRLWLAWVSSRDVEDADGVVDQWQTLEAARRIDGRWERLSEVAELSHGMLVNAGAGGYLGCRRRPMLVADSGRVWAVWERKDLSDGHTRRAVGILCGKRLDGGEGSAERELHRGCLAYSVTPQARGSRVPFVARDATAGATWDSGVWNVFEDAWGNLVLGHAELTDNTPQFRAEEATGWQRVHLAQRRPALPRRDVRAGGKPLSLFWGDPHFHTAQTGDAEGEVDELLHYARDQARLDFCAICDNDVYCLPLTDHAWARQHRFIEEFSAPGRFAVIPSHEWSWADPETGKPNHRLVLYAKPGEPLLHQVAPGGRDIDALARSVERTSGLLIGHHLGWVFADGSAEAAIEIASAWSPHMAVNPQAIHDTLAAGRRLGFTGGSDSHRRNPGFCGALTGVYASELSAAALVEAIRRRRTVATTGSRIAVELWIGDAFIGDDVQLAGRVPIRVRASAPRPIDSIALLRDGQAIKAAAGVNDVEATLELDEEVPPGTHWYYARVVLRGHVPILPHNMAVAQGNHAWTSPIWVTSPPVP